MHPYVGKHVQFFKSGNEMIYSIARKIKFFSIKKYILSASITHSIIQIKTAKTIVRQFFIVKSTPFAQNFLFAVTAYLATGP